MLTLTLVVMSALLLMGFPMKHHRLHASSSLRLW